MPDSNWLFRITNPAHRPLCLQGPQILEPMERIERSSVAYHATALPLSYIGWSQRGYSKSRPPRYECGALPPELLRHGASAENRTPLIGQAIRCPTNRPHPQKFWSGRRYSKSLLWVGGPGHTLYTTPASNNIQLSKISGNPYSHTSTFLPPAGSQLDNLRLKSPIKRKKGRPFLVAARFLKPVCYSKTVRSPRARRNWRASAYL